MGGSKQQTSCSMWQAMMIQWSRQKAGRLAGPRKMTAVLATFSNRAGFGGTVASSRCSVVDRDAAASVLAHCNERWLRPPQWQGHCGRGCKQKSTARSPELTQETATGLSLIIYMRFALSLYVKHQNNDRVLHWALRSEQLVR